MFVSSRLCLREGTKRRLNLLLIVSTAVPVGTTTGPETPFEHFSARTMPGPQNVGRSPTCGHFQDVHMVAEWSDPQ